MSRALITLVLVAAINGAEPSQRIPIDPIQGTVYAATGKPIAGATVKFGESVPDDATDTSTWKEIASTTTSSDGSFTLGKQYATQPDRFRELHITAPGHIGEELLMQSDTQHPQRFFSDYYGRPMPTADSVLWPSRPIDGQIADLDGKPVVGATVRLSGYSHTTKSDSAGRFVLEVPDFSSDTQHEMACSLEITHPDFLRASTEVRHFSNDFLVNLNPGVLLAGTVRDHESGKGIANMLVKAIPARGKEVTGTSDASGSYNVRVPAGKIELSVTRAHAQDPLSNNFVSSKRSITHFAAEGENKSDVNIEVVKGHVVRGRVVDSISKQPVPDAYFLLAVDGRDEQSREGRYAVQTDKQGDFIVTGIPAGSFTFMSMPSGNEIGVRKTPLSVPLDGDPAPVELIAIRTISDTTQPPIEQLVTGAVVNPDGTPAGLAIVEAYCDSPGRRGMEFCRSAPDGTFGIALGHTNMAGPGEFRAYDLGKQFAAVIEVADVNAPPQPFVVRMQRGATFGGTVRDEKGSPLSGISVVISRNVPSGNGFAQYALCRGITDTEGQYRTTPFIPSSRDAAASLTCQALRGELGQKYSWSVRPEGAYTQLNATLGAHTDGLNFTLKIAGGDAYFAATPAKAK